MVSFGWYRSAEKTTFPFNNGDAILVNGLGTMPHAYTKLCLIWVHYDGQCTDDVTGANTQFLVPDKIFGEGYWNPLDMFTLITAMVNVRYFCSSGALASVLKQENQYDVSM